jgi:hypothetical protein
MRRLRGGDTAAGGRLFAACATRAQRGMAIADRLARRACGAAGGLGVVAEQPSRGLRGALSKGVPSGLPVPVLMARVAAEDWAGAAELARKYPFRLCGCRTL